MTIDRIQNAEDAVFEALAYHSAIATTAAVHRAFAAFIRARTDLVIEGELPANALCELDQVAELGRKIGASLRGLSPDYPERRQRRTDSPGLYIVDDKGEPTIAEAFAGLTRAKLPK